MSGFTLFYLSGKSLAEVKLFFKKNILFFKKNLKKDGARLRYELAFPV
jgi:hypothetical protein